MFTYILHYIVTYTEPVSYTHLDVYKRQLGLLALVTKQIPIIGPENCFNFREQQRATKCPR